MEIDKLRACEDISSLNVVSYGRLNNKKHLSLGFWPKLAGRGLGGSEGPNLVNSFFSPNFIK